MAYEATLFAYANCCKPKTCGCDAGCQGGVVGADVAAVLREAGVWVCLFPEEQEIRVFQVIQKLVVLR